MDETEQLRYAFYRYWPELDVRLVDKVWEKLVWEGNVGRALKDPFVVDSSVDPVASALPILLSDAKPIMYGARIQQELSEPPEFDDRLPGTQAERKEPEETRPRLDAPLQEREVAFEEHVARIAADDPLVLTFRDRVLDGELLTPKRAQKFVNSPVNWYYTLGVLEGLGIPVVDHVGELSGEEGRPHPRHGNWRHALIRVEPPGIELSVARPVMSCLWSSSTTSGLPGRSGWPNCRYWASWLSLLTS